MGAYDTWLRTQEMNMKIKREREEAERKLREVQAARVKKDDTFEKAIQHLQNNDSKLATTLGRHCEEAQAHFAVLDDKHNYVMERVCALEGSVRYLEDQMLKKRLTCTKKRLKVTVCAGKQRVEIERQF